jgi:DNA-binding NarL/FixJ family response regulator
VDKIRCIFLFEDDADDVLLFREALQEVAPEVHLLVANSGEQGLPALNVLEPVVMLSTSDHKSIMREAYQKGASYYLPKPFSFDKLKSEIHHLLITKWDHGPIVL